MKTLNFKTVLTVAAATVSTVLVAGQSVQAGGFTKLDTDWHIVLDSFSDGRQGNNITVDSNFQMFGMAAKVENGEAYFAFNSNLGLQGRDGIANGDLFFNFTDKSFKDASAAQELFAVNFVQNEAGNGNLASGLYKDVSAKSVTSTNSGHQGFQYYRDRVAANGGTVGFGDLTPEEAQEYLTAFNGGYEDGNHSIQNVIDTGTKVADDGFALLDASELASVGFGNYSSKANTFGFKFDASKLPEGKALISLLQECINDGMAMKAHFEDGVGVEVPEPTSIVSLGLIGLALAGGKLRKKS